MYFGTDGIRGIACRELTTDLSMRLGNALSQVTARPTIVLGRDTRLSGQLLGSAFSTGAMLGGAYVIDVGILPTPGVAFLTKELKADYGVMISASHNPPEYNGLKVFDGSGHKLDESAESTLEHHFSQIITSDILGRLSSDEKYAKKYQKHLLNATKERFDGLTIALDSANGASYKIAKAVFKSLGARVKITACKNDGARINERCGSLHIENLVSLVKKCGADVGFAFDGDADRIIAVDKNLMVFDGDKLIYILAKYLKKNGQLKNNTVVGTSNTNSGICRALEKNKINMVRTDIGDKYVIEAMQNMNLSLGGEQSGHIILSQYATTGDGILTAIKLCEILVREKTTLSGLFDAKLYPQVNLTFSTSDKLRIVNSEIIKQTTNDMLSRLPISARILVRASGTEPKIRIMVESTREDDCRDCASHLLQIMRNIENYKKI